MLILKIFESRYVNYLLFFFFFAVTLLLYGSSLSNFYVLDDFVRLEVISKAKLQENFHFIPVPLLLYRFIYLIFELEPAPYRILNYVLNAAFCVLLFRTAIIVFSKFNSNYDTNKIYLVSFLSSFLFCIHYIHVETIVYFSELHELLFSFFYLLSFYFYLRFNFDKKKKYFYFIFFFYALCMLSKETAVTFIPLIFFSEILLFRKKILSIIKDYWALIGVTAAILTVRLIFFPEFENLSTTNNTVTIIKESVKNIIFTFTAFLFSLDFSSIKIIYRSAGNNFSDTFQLLLADQPQVIISIVLSFVFYFAVLKSKNKLNIILICFILIVSSSYLWIAGYERYLYLPSAAFWLMFINFLFKLKYSKSKLFLWSIIFIIFTYNIYNLELKEANWIKASEISKNTLSEIIKETEQLPEGSMVFFKDLPGEYNGAWVLRYGIHQIPGLFMNNKNVKFYYFYEYETGNYSGNNIYIYEYTIKTLNKIN